MSEQSIFDHKSISTALKDAFNRIKNTELQIEMAILGRETPYIINGSVNGKFYFNGMSLEIANSFFVIPYTSVLYVEIVGTKE